MKNIVDDISVEFEHNMLGENFKEFKGKPSEAIEHLIKVKRGQVVGAMSKKGFGEIDFVYGEITDAKKHKGLGIAHIIDKHGEDMVRKIPEIIDNSIEVLNNGRRAILETTDHRIIIGLVFDDIDKVWLVSGFEMTDTAKAKSPALAKSKKDMNSSSSTVSLYNKIIADGKNKVNKIKNADGYNNKADATVDIVWDTVMKGFDIGAIPVKQMIGAMNPKFNPKKDWFAVTEIQKEVSEVVNDFRNAKAGIYDSAGDIKDFLGGLSKEDSKSLVRTLGGDLDPNTLSPELKKLYDRFRTVIDEKATQLVELGALKEENKIEDYLKRYYKQYVEDEHSGSSVAYEKLKKRKDLTLDERIALGMLEDADFVIPQTIAEQNIQIQRAKTLKILADKFGSEKEIEGYVQISNAEAGGSVKKWGALADKWVDPEIKKELDLANLVQEQLRIVEDGLYPVIDHLKVNLTVKNPVTHVYNIASNIMLSGLNGDFLAVGKILYMRYKTPNKFKKLVKEANALGLNSYLDDFEQGHIDLMPDGKNVNVASSIYKNLYMTQDSKLGKGVRKLYDWEDKIFKLASYKRIMDENKGIDSKKAFRMATDVYVDYSTPLPAGVRVLDKSGLMPFLHYQYKSTPAVAKVMAKNKFRTTMMSLGVLGLGASAWTNDEEENFKPDWAKDKFNLFGVSEWVRLGNGYYINAGRMIPATKFEFELGGIIKGALGIVNGKTPLGYDINGKYDGDIEKYAQRALVMAENYLPSATLGRYMQRGVGIELGKAGITKPKKNYYKEDMTHTELGARAMGVRKFNEKKELEKKLKEAKSRKKHLDKNGADKNKTKKQYDKEVKKIRKAGASIKMNLSYEEKKDIFNFKMGF